MKIETLIQQIKIKKSLLCVGLDTDSSKIPEHIKKLPNPIFEFNKQIIDATAPYTIAYKPNIAFYEAEGLEGWRNLEQTIFYIQKKYPEIFTIADAKRGDIGNTSSKYARAFFEKLNFDAITVAPYMGKDSVEPFLQYTDKHTILLALTSNLGAYDFQTQTMKEKKALYQKVLSISKTWQNAENLMYVVGATKAEYLKTIREIVPNSFLLVPGVGAQGGSIDEVCKYGLNSRYGLLINSSRAILYASNGIDFEKAARKEAEKLQKQMSTYI